MTIQKKILLLTTVLCSCFLVACEAPKKEEAKKAPTIEEIHREKGKPAKVSPVSKQTLADYRIFSGAISGKQQASAIAKMADPIKEIKVSIGSTVKKDQVLAEYLFTGDNTGKEQAEEQGYFWAVTQAKLIEGSAVVLGSNPITPTLSNKNDEPLKDTQQNKDDSRAITINAKEIEDYLKLKLLQK